MKKIIALILSILMFALCFTGCSKGKNNEDFVILDENFGSEQYAVAFRKGDNALMQKIQEILEAMYADGSAAEISTKWFGSDVIVKDAAYPSEFTVAADDNSLNYVLEKGNLILGLDPSFPPMGYVDADSQETVGFDIDLAKEVCKRLNIELKLQPIDWTAKELELNAKNIDVIWNGFSINPERVEAYTLSKPYLNNDQIIIVPKDSAIKTKADLASKKIALQSGSTAFDAVSGDAIYASLGEVVEYEDNLSAFLDLKSGRVDAFVVDAVVGRYLLAGNE